MGRRFSLATVAIGLLFAGQGCSAVILYQSIGSIREIPLGSPRQKVEARLGKRVSSRPLPDGGSVDTYEYVVRNPKMAREAFEMAAQSVITLGLTEVAFIPMALYQARKNRQMATLTFGPDDNLIDYGPPPPYGPPDETVGGLSRRDISERCRSEHPMESRDGGAGASGQRLPFPDYPYHECVVGRLATWGIE